MEEEREAVGVVEVAKKRCKNVIDRINSLPNSKMTDSCKRTLLRLANSELNFLSRSSSPSSLRYTLSRSSSPSSLSVDIGHLEAVIHIIQQPFIAKVSLVCEPIPMSPTNENWQKNDSFSIGVHVYIVYTLNGGSVWFIVSDRNLKYVSWKLAWISGN